MHKFVKEGIDDAFKRFRQIKVRAGLGDAEAPPELRAPESVKSEELAKAVLAAEVRKAEEPRLSMGDMAATRQYTVTEGDKIVTVTEVFDNKDNAYHVVGRTESLVRDDKDSKSLAA